MPPSFLQTVLLISLLISDFYRKFNLVPANFSISGTLTGPFSGWRELKPRPYRCRITPLRECGVDIHRNCELLDHHGEAKDE